jgi:opacity protein-like surface antigen
MGSIRFRDLCTWHTSTDSDSETHIGWVLGCGIEAILVSDIMGRIEFLHYEFDDKDFFFRFDPQSDAYNLFGNTDFDVNVVRASVNILF